MTRIYPFHKSDSEKWILVVYAARSPSPLRRSGRRCTSASIAHIQAPPRSAPTLRLRLDSSAAAVQLVLAPSPSPLRLQGLEPNAAGLQEGHGVRVNGPRQAGLSLGGGPLGVGGWSLSERGTAAAWR